MADTVRGNGLSKFETALAALASDPESLDRARTRFSDSPPSYKSCQSHNSTRSQSLDAPNGEQRRHEERRRQLIIERAASLPNEQLGAQVHEEEQRIIRAVESRRLLVPVGTNYYELAKKNVKKSWVEQGIWNNTWNDMAQGRWKHEESLEPSSQSETDSKEPPKPNLFFSSLGNVKSKPRRRKSDKEIRQASERRAIQERERDASRPFHQFVHQVSKERERIQDELRVGDTTSVPADINTRAYKHVKNIWIKRGIWDMRWGTLPGMSWKHECPVEEVLGDDPAPVEANPPEDYGRAGEGISSIFERRPSTEPIHPTADTASFQEGIPPAIDPPVSENGNAQHRLLRAERRRGVGSATRRRPGLGKRNELSEVKQSSSMAETFLKPVRPSRVSKPRTTRTALRQGSNLFEGLAKDNSPSLVGRRIHEPGTQAAGMPTRRSERLTQNSKTENVGEVAPTDPPSHLLRARQRRDAGALKPEIPAKPQGVSKRQHGNRRRGAR